jgi:hypothetical protein
MAYDQELADAYRRLERLIQDLEALSAEHPFDSVGIEVRALLSKHNADLTGRSDSGVRSEDLLS